MGKTTQSAVGRASLPVSIGIALSYYLTAQVSLSLALVGTVVTPIWPPTGIALVALLRYGPGIWPAIAVGALGVNLPIAGSVPTAVAIALGNTLAPLLTLLFLRRARFRPSLERLHDCLLLIGGGLACMTVSALVGSTALLIGSSLVDGAHFWETFAVWWAGDASGVLIFAPALLVIGKPLPQFTKRSRRNLELFALTCGLVVITPIAFLSPTVSSRFLIFPLVVWAAVRFGQVGAVFTTLLVTLIATVAEANGAGPFSEATLLSAMLNLQAFNVSVAATALILSSATEERSSALRLVRESADRLEDAVLLRSAELLEANERLSEEIRQRDLARRTLGEQAGIHRQEHEIAETLQRALLPDRLPELRGLTLAARYLPGSAGIEVGGDWYDVFTMPTGRVGLVVGDVIGRGLKAAASMGQLRIALRAYALDTDDPASVLNRLSSLLEELKEAGMATVFFGIVDYGNLSFRFASAGHPPPLLIRRDGSAYFLEGGRRPPLGVQIKGEPTAAADLEPGTTLLLYTDGLIETRTQAIDVGMNRLKSLATSTDLDLELLCDKLIGGLVEVAQDDVALLALRTTNTPAEGLTLTVTSEPMALLAARRALALWLRQVGATRLEVEDLVLASNEAIGNSIEHAYKVRSGSILVEAELKQDLVEVRVIDGGEWQEPDPRGPGRGFLLMSSVLDSVKVEHDAAGTTVRLARTLSKDWKGPGRPVQFITKMIPYARLTPDPDRIPVVKLCEDIDLGSAAPIDRQLEAHVRNLGVDLILDLTEVRFMDSAGLRLLFGFVERLGHQSGHLVVVSPQDSPVRHILDLARFSTVCTITADIESARRAMTLQP